MRPNRVNRAGAVGTAAAVWVLVLGCGASPSKKTSGPGASGRPEPARPARVEPARPRPRRAPPAPPDFARDFKDRTLRVDLVHLGTATRELYRVHGMVGEGRWPGSRTVLVDPDDWGQHRFLVREQGTGRVIFRQGYGSLFGEWQTTDEAKSKLKTFSESVRFPMPKRPFRLELYSRDRKSVYKKVASFPVDPAVMRVMPMRRDPLLKPVALHKSGPSHLKLDVLILGDGYTAKEQQKLMYDARRYARVLLTSEPFAKHKNDINIWMLPVVSAASGVTEPRKGLIRNTALGLSFNTFNSPRYLMTLANKKMREVAAHAPYDQLYLMANTSRYGGGGIYNLYSVYPSDNEYDEYVYIHEFGHSFGGLGDEYYTSPVATNEMYPVGVEPWEPNLTRFLKGRFKWKALVTAGTPLPTPADAKRYSKVVGLFEGAGYTGKGMFRPALNCKMFSKAHIGFCPVCARAVERRMTRYTR